MVSLEFLRTHPLFGGINDNDLKLVRKLFKKEFFLQGQNIICEGELGDRLYFIHKGSVEILKKVVTPEREEEERIAVLFAGDTFGEMEIIDVQPRVATVRAMRKTETLSLSNADLYKVSQKNLQAFTIIIMNIAREISRRLRKMDAMVAGSLFAADGNEDRNGKVI